MKVDQISIITFVEKYKFEKLSTVAEFEAFDQRLENDEYVKDLVRISNKTILQLPRSVC